MKNFIAITVFLASVSSFVSTASSSVASDSITYKVISNVPDDQTLAVILDDNHVYPLTDTSIMTPLLHMGEAPRPSKHYKYAIVNKDTNNIITQEPFTRTISSDDTDSTFNEHFNRTWNVKEEYQLPNILEPLPIIKRIKSKIHIPGQIPTLHIMGNSSGIDYIHTHQLEHIDVEDMKMVYISLDDVRTFDNVIFSVSGHGSRYLSKLSYTIKLPKKQDLYKYRRFKLRASAMDPSYIRENIAYGVANSIGLPTSQYSYVRLYINNQSVGLFGFTEVLKNPWPRNEFANGNKNYKQGTLYVAGREGLIDFASKSKPADFSKITSDFAYFGNNISMYKQHYPVKEKPSEGTVNYTRIMDFTKFLSEQPNNTTVDNSVVPRWEEYINVESVLRTLAFEVFVMDSDGYLTNGNNFILYDDLESKRFVMSDQDLDVTCGTVFAQYNVTAIYSANYSDFPGLLSRPLSSKILNVPQFKEKFEELLQSYTSEFMTSGVIKKRIDSLYNMIKEDVAWQKTLPTMGVLSMPISDYRKVAEKLLTITFDEAVYGPVRDALQLPVAVWAKKRGEDLESYFKQTTATN